MTQSTISGVLNCDVQLFTPLSYSNRSHKLCILPNGILTLLISDPEDKMTSCSISVASGSHSDLKGRPGIAHLFEHMLLAGGSNKYPKPGYYIDTVAKYNGFQNAFTTGEQTTFYFEVPVMSTEGVVVFEKVMDIFSSYFRDPIFNPLIMNKEVYAINSEHEANMSSLSKILYQATRLLANPDHPFNQFSTGNIKSLGSMSEHHSKNLHTVLIEYYKKNVCPHKMTMCLRGPQSVNALTKIAYSKMGTNLKRKRSIRRSLSSIKINPLLRPKLRTENNKKPNNINDFNILEKEWSPKYANIPCFIPCGSDNHNAIFITSNKNMTVRFMFPINLIGKPLFQKDIRLFSKIWCDLFGDESPVSCCELFKEKEWIIECFAYVSDFTIQDIGLVMELELTYEGWKNLDEMSQILFSVVIPKFSKGNLYDLATYMKDINSIDIVSFINKKKETSPMEETSELSGLLLENLNDLNVCNIFKGHGSLSEDSSNSNSEILDDDSQEMLNWWLVCAIKFQTLLTEFMTPSNVRVIVLGANLRKCGLINGLRTPKYKTDQHFEFNYFTKFIDFTNSKNKFNFKNFKILYPVKNIFILPEYHNLIILRQILLKSSLKSRYSSLIPLSKPTRNNLPRLTSFNSRYEIWVSEDKTMCDPISKKTILTFELASTIIEPSPHNTIYLEILGQLLFKLISAKLYSAIKCGYSYSIAASDRGEVTLKFTIYGFTQGIISILKCIIDGAKKILAMNGNNKREKEYFRKARILTRNKYKNASMDNCIKSCSIGLLILLEKHIWTLDDRTDALDDIDIEQFLKFSNLFLGNDDNFSTIFIQGDLSEADNINNFLNDHLTRHFSTKANFPGSPHRQLNKPQKTIILKPGTNYFLEHDGSVDDPNNGISFFIQFGMRKDLRIVTLTYFTAYLISLSLVSELRNKRQVGYVVMGGVRELTETIGIHITIMSSNSPESLEENIEEYLEYFENDILGTIDDSYFLKEYIKKYINIISLDVNNSNGNCTASESVSGPINLMNEIIPNVREGNNEIFNSSEMKQHQFFMNKIIENGEFNYDMENLFSKQKQILERITLTEYKNFIHEKISAFSSKRSKISIRIKSVMSEEEIHEQQLLLQIGAFLRMKGLLIDNKELKQIIVDTRGSPLVLAKRLLSTFRDKGEGWRLCSAIMKEIYGSIETASYQRLIKAPLNTIHHAVDIKNYVSPRQIQVKQDDTIAPAGISRRIKVPLIEIPGPNAFRD